MVRMPESEPQRRAIRALLASAGAGAIIYVVIIRVALPAALARMTPDQLAWLREAFRVHPWGILLGILLGCAIAALPVLLVFRLVYGPLRQSPHD